MPAHPLLSEPTRTLERLGRIWTARISDVPVNYPPRGEPYEVRVYDPHLQETSAIRYTGQRLRVGSESLVRLARLTGAPKVRGAGVDLFKKLGDTVRRGEPLYRVHAGFASDLRFALAWAAQGNGYTIGGHAVEQTVAEF